MFVLLSACARAHLKAMVEWKPGVGGAHMYNKMTDQALPGSGEGLPYITDTSLSFIELEEGGGSLLQGPGRAAASKNPD